MASSGRKERGARRVVQRRAASSTSRAAHQFERLVAEAVNEIPEPFRSKLANVAVVVEDKPSSELLSNLGVPPGETLLGLYDGIPLTQRGDWYNLVPPDRIIIFRRPILAMCQTTAEIREEVRRTVLHEVAHFYGIDDDELDRMGFS